VKGRRLGRWHIYYYVPYRTYYVDQCCIGYGAVTLTQRAGVYRVMMYCVVRLLVPCGDSLYLTLLVPLVMFILETLARGAPFVRPLPRTEIVSASACCSTCSLVKDPESCSLVMIPGASSIL